MNNNQYKHITNLGTRGNNNGQFDLPSGVAVDNSGNVYVADAENHRIQKFNSSGTWLWTVGGSSSGSGNGQFFYPEGVAVDCNGNVYVADTGNHRIQKFDSNGTYITQFGSYGNGNGQFRYPNGVAVDNSGNVYVADTQNHRIQVFAPEPEPEMMTAAEIAEEAGGIPWGCIPGALLCGDAQPNLVRVIRDIYDATTANIPPSQRLEYIRQWAEEALIAMGEEATSDGD